jgi:hypothetical protein
MRTFPLVVVLSLATLAGCGGETVIAIGPDGGGSSGSSSGSGSSGSASSGTTGSGSVSSGSAGSGSSSSGAAGSGAVTVGSGGSGNGSDAGLACFTDSVGADYRGCAVDADCAIKDHQTDCDDDGRRKWGDLSLPGHGAVPAYLGGWKDLPDDRVGGRLHDERGLRRKPPVRVPRNRRMQRQG